MIGTPNKKNQKKKAVFNWSGGKDSALALQKILEENEYEVVSLLTTINEQTRTSSIHSIPIELLKLQAESIGIPLYTMTITEDLRNYDHIMLKTVEHFKKQGVTHFIFGDIFLEDVKTYREKKLNPMGIEVVEPLWDKPSQEVLTEFLKSRIKTKIIITQADKLDKTFIGRELDINTILLFPDDMDLCGENGEYHTFAYAGSLFKKDIHFSLSTPKEISYDIRLDNGETKTYKYWQADISEKKLNFVETNN